MELLLANGKSVEVSQTEIGDFVTQILIPNADWRHSGQLTEGEVMRFLKAESSRDELRKVARYILTYTENLAFTAYLFDKAEGKPEQTKEFNMPAIKKLRELCQKVKGDRQTMLGLSHTVNEMESVCLGIGVDPL